MATHVEWHKLRSTIMQIRSTRIKMGLIKCYLDIGAVRDIPPIFRVDFILKKKIFTHFYQEIRITVVNDHFVHFSA